MFLKFYENVNEANEYSIFCILFPFRHVLNVTKIKYFLCAVYNVSNFCHFRESCLRFNCIFSLKSAKTRWMSQEINEGNLYSRLASSRNPHTHTHTRSRAKTKLIFHFLNCRNRKIGKLSQLRLLTNIMHQTILDEFKNNFEELT